MQDVEIEIQVQVDEIDLLKQYLKKRGRYLGSQQQHDEYFTPADRNFLEAEPVKEWLRLRTSNTTGSITYKNWQYTASGRADYCDEFEAGLQDNTQMRKILVALNFRSLVVVDKKRATWRIEDYEVSIDTVRGLGEFVEVEYKGSAKDIEPSVVVEQMIQFLKNVGCTNIQRNYRGYPYLLLFPEKGS